MNTPNNVNIQDEAPLGKYFHIMLNMEDDDLDPYQYRLLGHYRRVCGASKGTCTQSHKTIAEKTKMSVGKITEVRDELESMGYIKVERRGDNETYAITIIDRMADNVQRFAKKTGSPDEQPVHQVNSPVHDMNTPRSPGEPKNNPKDKNNQNQEEKRLSLSSSDDGKKKRSSKSSEPTLAPEESPTHKEMFQAICDAFGYDTKRLTTITRGQVSKAAKELLTADLKPWQVRYIYSYVEERFDRKTPMILASQANNAIADYKRNYGIEPQPPKTFSTASPVQEPAQPTPSAQPPSPVPAATPEKKQEVAPQIGELVLPPPPENLKVAYVDEAGVEYYDYGTDYIDGLVDALEKSMSAKSGVKWQ